MLAAEALRLAAIEILCPTAAIAADSGYPTRAGARVFDSRAVALEDIDPTKAFTPVLSLYTNKSGVKLRGPHAAAGDTNADAVLEIIAELAVVSGDEGGEFADAMASDDPDARLVLAALCAQVRWILERSQQGGLWRQLVRQITETEFEPFAVPEIGMRWQRVTIRMHCEIRDDDFDMTDGGLPEPIRALYDQLPSASYAKEKLAALAAYFVPEPLQPLTQIHVTTGLIESGPDDLSP
jgi:hypothetical protein